MDINADKLTLPELIERRRAGRPNHALARACGGFPGEGQWQKYSAGNFKVAPGAEVVRAFAMVLDVSTNVVWLAAGRSLGVYKDRTTD